MLKDIYIIGDNIISPLGNTTAENFEQMKAGFSGLKQVVYEGAVPLQACAALIGEAQTNLLFDQLNLQGKTYTRLEQFMISSISDAVKQAAIDVSDKRTLIIISTTKGNIDLLNPGRYPNVDPKRLYIGEMAKAIANYFNNPIKPIVTSNACISGVSAIITGARLIASGKYDTVIACGGDIIDDFTLSGFQSFKALSDEPCRPFDKDRKGLNLGEGIGTVVLSRTKKNKAIKVLGGATSNDANHISGPSRDGSGLKIAIKSAVGKSNVGYNKIDLISAHGTATPYNDEMETLAFSDMGMDNCVVNSLKGYFGHTLGGAGIIETVASTQMMREGLSLKTLGFDHLGVSQPISVSHTTENKPINYCLKTASGFGGCNAALVLARV